MTKRALIFHIKNRQLTVLRITVLPTSAILLIRTPACLILWVISSLLGTQLLLNAFMSMNVILFFADIPL